MVRWVGFEPTTTSLKGSCSTPELPARRSLYQRREYINFLHVLQDIPNACILPLLIRNRKSLWKDQVFASLAEQVA